MLGLAACAHRGPAPNASLMEIRAAMTTASPLGDCLPRALGALGDTDDLGRVSAQTSRYLGPLELEEDAVQRHLLRFFTSQDEVGPRFFDAVVVEWRCGDGTFRLQATAVPQAFGKATPPSSIEPRFDALLAHVRTTCRIVPLAEEPAHTLNWSRGGCAS